MAPPGLKGRAGPTQAFHLHGESPAQLVGLADPVMVEHDEREGVLFVAGHQQLELLVPHGMPRGVGDGALQLAVRAQVQPACSLLSKWFGATCSPGAELAQSVVRGQAQDHILSHRLWEPP